jgi:hypothetical protein
MPEGAFGGHQESVVNSAASMEGTADNTHYTMNSVFCQGFLQETLRLLQSRIPRDVTVMKQLAYR